MKKLSGFLASMLITASFLTACGSGSGTSGTPQNESAGKQEQAGGGTSETVKLNYWVPFSGGDGDFMKEMVNKFNQENPDTNVQILNLKNEEYYTKLSTAMVSGQAPDVAIAHTSKLAELVPTGNLEVIDTIAPDLDWNSFNPNILGATVFDGNHMAIPLDTHAEIMFYNKKILGDAGLLDADGKPKMEPGAEGFVKFLREIKAKAPADVMPLATTSKGNQPYWLWWTLYSQMGGQLLTEDGKKADFNNEKSKQALQFLADLVNEDLWPKNIKNGGEIFSAGKGAISLNGVWSTGTFEKNKDSLDFGAVSFPQLYDKPAAWGDSHTLVIPVQKNKDEKKAAAAAKFANWLADHGAMWAKAGHVPSKLTVAESQEFKSLPYRSDYAEVANVVAFLPNSDKVGPIKEILVPNFDKLMTGQATVDQVLADAEKQVNDLLAK